MKQINKNLSEYLNPEIVSKLNSYEIKARYVVDGFIAGMHKSPYHGFSVEFSEHRPYMQGDPLKNIDWKIYAKSDKYFIKQFEEETNLIAHIVLDISNSMDFVYSGKVTKLEYGKTLAASILYLLIKQRDAAGLCLYSNKLDSYLPPKSKNTYLGQLLEQLTNVEIEQKTEFEKALSDVAEKVNKRGLTIIISDLFDDPERVVSAIKKFRFKKNEVIVFQLIDPIEESFDFPSEAIFVDKEFNDEITTHPIQIKQEYRKKFNEFSNKIKSELLNSGIDFYRIHTSTSYDNALISYFKKRASMN